MFSFNKNKDKCQIIGKFETTLKLFNQLITAACAIKHTYSFVQHYVRLVHFSKLPT